MSKPKLTLSSLIGQEAAKNRLRMYAAAYFSTGTLPFLCITGQKGGGKSTLLRAFHNELVRADKSRPNFIEVNAATIGVKSFFEDLVPLWQQGNVLFLDEVHNLSEKLQEIFLTLLDSRDETKREISYSGETFEIDFARSSIIMATTDPQKLCGPLKSRLNTIELESYSESQLVDILSLNLSKYKIDVEDEVLEDARGILRGDPRQVALLVKDGIQHFCAANGIKQLDLNNWKMFRKTMGVFPHGLESSEIAVLRALDSGELNLTGIAGCTGLSRSAIQYSFEPRLIQLRAIEIEGKRRITNKGRQILREIERFGK